MTTRAESANKTRDCVVSAAVDCFGSQPFDAVSLKAIAAAAGVGLQTVIRVGKSKEELFMLAAERLLADMAQQLTDVPDDNPEVVLGFLMATYEAWGDRMMRLLTQEDRIPTIKDFARRIRSVQAMRIQRLFEDQLAQLDDAARERRLVSLMAISGSHMWHVLRRVHGLSREQTASSIWEMVSGIMRLG